MKKTLFLLLAFAACFNLHAQFRMVGTASWSTVNDSTYTASVSFQSDLTGMGYLATQIVDTFRVFTPVEKIYRVDSVWNKTFSSANLRVVEYGGTQGVPSGQVMVYDPAGKTTVPQVPFGSTGATAQMQAAVDAYNARQVTNGAQPSGRIAYGNAGGNTLTSDTSLTWNGDSLYVDGSILSNNTVRSYDFYISGNDNHFYSYGNAGNNFSAINFNRAGGTKAARTLPPLNAKMAEIDFNAWHSTAGISRLGGIRAIYTGANASGFAKGYVEIATRNEEGDPYNLYPRLRVTETGQILFNAYTSANFDATAPTIVATFDGSGNIGKAKPDSAQVTNPITNSGLVSLRTALRSVRNKTLASAAYNASTDILTLTDHSGGTVTVGIPTEAGDGNGIYDGGDSLSQSATTIDMAVTQDLGFGNVAANTFPSVETSSSFSDMDFGLQISPNTQGSIYSFATRNRHRTIAETNWSAGSIYSEYMPGISAVLKSVVNVNPTRAELYSQKVGTNMNRKGVGSDTTGAYIITDSASRYYFPGANPSISNGVKNILLWTGTGSTATPSFADPTTGLFTFTNGLTNTSGTVKLGGALTESTTFNASSNNNKVTFNWNSFPSTLLGSSAEAQFNLKHKVSTTWLGAYNFGGNGIQMRSLENCGSGCGTYQYFIKSRVTASGNYKAISSNNDEVGGLVWGAYHPLAGSVSWADSSAYMATMFVGVDSVSGSNMFSKLDIGLRVLGQSNFSSTTHLISLRNNSTVIFPTYGAGSREAADLGKTSSGYIQETATDGTMMDRAISSLLDGYTFTNAITKTGTTVKLGGALIENTQITGNFNFQLIPDGTAAVTIGNLNDGTLFARDTSAYLGFSDNQGGLINFGKPDSTTTIYGAKISLKGRGNHSAVLQYYDADNTNKITERAPATVGTNYGTILPAAAPGNNTVRVFQSDGTSAYVATSSVADDDDNSNSGKFTPTITAAGTDTILTVFPMTYTRTDSIVTFSVSFRVAWTAANYGTAYDDFSISLPVASNFTLEGLGTATQDSDVKAVADRRQSDAQTLFFTPLGQAFAYADATNDKIMVRATSMHDSAPAFPAGRTRITVTGQYVVK